MVALQPSRRPLTTAEQRLLSLRIRDLGLRRARSGRVLALGAAVVGILWFTTFVASNAPGIAITGFWTVVAIILTVWILRDVRRERRYIDDAVEAYRSAQQANQAEVYHVRARAYVEFEEVEDEGACYAFELTGTGVVFVVGQEFYAAARFPSLDFDLVHLLDEAGRVVDAHLAKRGQQAAPTRVIPRARKRDLMIPEHLEVVGGPLDRIEDTLESLRT